MAKPYFDNETVLALIAQAESFAVGLQLMALALEELPKERAGAIAASATEIVMRMDALRMALRLVARTAPAVD